ncbi:hypothetical protein LSH36_23g08083 [Paralvinella palmiformis]|uniref:Uncharacterized protein n=1 Tax=Paralvinella palmiformis TaxID=53620 RepID=A0AAD9NHZ8_9ANNE|nr:hypothetical protein LSH36_23g08083 [Paralvinella palmiformis]
MKQSTVVLLVACIVIAYHMQLSDAQFSFSLPGKWGNGKRSFSFSLPGKWGSGKRGFDTSGADCGSLSPQTLFQVLTLIEAEAQKVSECLAKAELEQRTDDKH